MYPIVRWIDSPDVRYGFVPRSLTKKSIGVFDQFFEEIIEKKSNPLWRPWSLFQPKYVLTVIYKHKQLDDHKANAKLQKDFDVAMSKYGQRFNRDEWSTIELYAFYKHHNDWRKDWVKINRELNCLEAETSARDIQNIGYCYNMQVLIDDKWRSLNNDKPSELFTTNL